VIIIIIMNLIIKMGERKMVTGQGHGMGIGGCNRLCPAAMGHSLVALFFCPCRLRTVRCMDLVKSQIYYPKHILTYGSGKTCYSLVVDFGSSRTDGLEAGIGGGLSTTLRSGLKCGGLESKFGWGPGTLDRSGTGWSRLCLGYERGVCFSWYPVGHIDSRIAVST
jgi:hypothetical protein